VAFFGGARRRIPRCSALGTITFAAELLHHLLYLSSFQELFLARPFKCGLIDFSAMRKTNDVEQIGKVVEVAEVVVDLEKNEVLPFS
jgi:hypothetical protein